MTDLKKLAEDQVKYFRNVANHGRGSEMTKALHDACDEIERLQRQLAALQSVSAAHTPTDNCGFDRNASASENTYVCTCGWRTTSGYVQVPMEIQERAKDAIWRMDESLAYGLQHAGICNMQTFAVKTCNCGLSNAYQICKELAATPTPSDHASTPPTDALAPQSGKKEDGWKRVEYLSDLECDCLMAQENVTHIKRVDKDRNFWLFELPPLPSPPASKAEGES